MVSLQSTFALVYGICNVYLLFIYYCLIIMFIYYYLFKRTIGSFIRSKFWGIGVG